MLKRTLSLHTVFRQLPRGQYKVVRLFSETKKNDKELTTEQVIEMEPVCRMINMFE